MYAAAPDLLANAAFIEIKICRIIAFSSDCIELCMVVSFAQTAFRDVSPMEMSLCSASLRFLSFIADKAKTSSACRQLFLVSGGIRASLFASAVYPPSSSLRRLAMEVVRHIRRRDLDELAQHVRMHDGLMPSAMTSAGMHINA